MGLKGNQVTFFMLVCALVGAGLFFVGGAIGYVGGAALMLLSWILDHCDGEVLRFRGESSNRGIYLDRFTHRVSYPLVHLGIGTSLYRQTGGAYWLLFAGVVAYVIQVGTANSLDKALIELKRGGVELFPFRALRLRITARLPRMEWPLKLALGGYAEIFENNTLMILMAAAALVGVVPKFYFVYGSLVIFNWLLVTLLDFAICLRGPGERQIRNGS